MCENECYRPRPPRLVAPRHYHCSSSDTFPGSIEMLKSLRNRSSSSSNSGIVPTELLPAGFQSLSAGGGR
jgi:hypothetical protein